MTDEDEQALLALHLEGWEVKHTKFWANDYIYVPGGHPAFKSVVDASAYIRTRNLAPRIMWMK